MADDHERKHRCIYDNGEPIDYADGDDEYNDDEDGNYERVWVVFCYWDQPYLVENQWNILGVFSSEANAQKQREVHLDYASRVPGHTYLKCSTVIEEMRLDVYAEASGGI